MKKIVLLSDGTGNGAAKRHKTNVWRLYDALDLNRSLTCAVERCVFLGVQVWHGGIELVNFNALMTRNSVDAGIC